MELSVAGGCPSCTIVAVFRECRPFLQKVASESAPRAIRSDLGAILTSILALFGSFVVSFFRLRF